MTFSKGILFFLLFYSLQSMGQPQVFSEKQLGNQRVWNARLSCDETLKNLFESNYLSYPPKYVYWRAFKKEKQLELWAADSAHHRYKLIKTYAIVNTSGTLGPKRSEGDFQIPEGYYHINQYNPYSNFYLSFKVSYPNKSDSILGKKGQYGGQIFVHGDSLTIGCLPMSNEVIKELYWCNIQVNSNKNNNYYIPIHIYPCRMNATNWNFLKKTYSFDPVKLDFWKNLQSGYNFFELMKTPPKPLVDQKGKYWISY